jgi:drug/metabolite transporter (DMT)-like permease
VLVATAGLGLMTLEGAIGSISRGDLLTFDALLRHWVRRAHRGAGPFSEQMAFNCCPSQVGAAAVLALSLFWWAETPRVQWRPAVVCAILITGLLCTALAFTIQAWAQQYTTSTRTA